MRVRTAGYYKAVQRLEKRLKGALLDCRRKTGDPFLEESEIQRMIRFAAGKE